MQEVISKEERANFNVYKRPRLRVYFENVVNYYIFIDERDDDSDEQSISSSVSKSHAFKPTKEELENVIVDAS